MKTVRCSGTKDNGDRCTRTKKVPDDFGEKWYCYQHPGGKDEDLQDLTNDEYYNLSAVQLKAIDMLVSGEFTKTEIAKQCKITRQTIYNWLDDSQFQKAYDERVEEIRSKFSPKLLQMINSTMQKCKPSNLEGELSKIEALERLIKLNNLLNNKPTDITKNEHSGMMEHQVINKYDYMTKEQMEKEAKRLKSML